MPERKIIYCARLAGRVFGCSTRAGARARRAARGLETGEAVELVRAFVPAGHRKTARPLQDLQDKRTNTSRFRRQQVGRTGQVGHLSKEPSGRSPFMEVSAVLITNQSAGLVLRHSDFTPIALMNSEYVVFAVKSDSPPRPSRNSSRGSKGAASAAHPVGPLGGANTSRRRTSSASTADGAEKN